MSAPVRPDRSRERRVLYRETINGSRPATWWERFWYRARKAMRS